jgi:hypothetical protein
MPEKSALELAVRDLKFSSGGDVAVSTRHSRVSTLDITQRPQCSDPPRASRAGSVRFFRRYSTDHWLTADVNRSADKI